MELLTEGLEHGRWTRLPKESCRYGETWTGSASAVMVIMHARTHAHREHADVPSTSGKSFCLSRQTPSTCTNTGKIGFRKGRNHIHGTWCSSSLSQCESVAKSCSEAMMGLMKLRADGFGGGQAVLNFVGLGAELIGQATGWKERACGSAVSSLKRKKNHQWQYNRQFSSVAYKGSDPGCWGEYSSLSGQFSGVICVSGSQEILLCREPDAPFVWVVSGSWRHPLHSLRDAARQ